MKLSLFNLIVSLFFVVPSVHGQCTSCENGIEVRDADPLGDGFYNCRNIDSFYLFSFAENSPECKGAQLEVMSNCCPSQVKDIPKDNSCGWCPNGVTNLADYFKFSFRPDPISCEELMLLVATGTPETGICAIAGFVSSMCCPGDPSSSTGVFPFTCEFCGSTGVEFPARIIPEAENLTCSKIGAAALLANETICDASLKPLEESCCPNYESPPGCEFCANGLDNPSLVLPLSGITCEQLKESAPLAPEGTRCEVTYKPVESLCCPSINDTASCDFCSSGLESPTATIPFLEDWTCQDFQNSTSAIVSSEPDCSGIKAAEVFCCPNTTDVVTCEFCPGGLESSNQTVPLLGGVTCNDFQAAAGSIKNATECATSIKPLEGLCCPGTTDSFQCDWCSGEAGVEFPEREFAGIGLRCGTISALVPAVTYEELCDQYKAAESLCCPSSVVVDPFPVTEDDYCHICGSAEVVMQRSEYQPYAFGASNDTGDLRTCAELEVSFNDARSAGDSCIDALSLFNLRFSPSICGCEGVVPPNPCEFCSGKGVNRELQVPGENFTCGEGFDFLQHVSPVFCSNPELDLVAMEGVCCTDIVEDNGTGEKSASMGSVRTGLLVALASLFIGAALV